MTGSPGGLERLGLGVDREGGGLGDGRRSGRRRDADGCDHGRHRPTVRRRTGLRPGRPRAAAGAAGPTVRPHPGGPVHSASWWCRHHCASMPCQPGASGCGADPKGRSSIGRVPVSKTGGWGFESLRPCDALGRCTRTRTDRGDPDQPHDRQVRTSERHRARPRPLSAGARRAEGRRGSWFARIGAVLPPGRRRAAQGHLADPQRADHLHVRRARLRGRR